MDKDIEILQTFLLANIPEIISQEEFDNVKRAIQNLINKNKKLEEKVKIIDHMCLVNKEEYQLIKNNDYIPKSKVREKIEELDRIIEPKQNRHQFLCIEVNKVGSETEIDNIAEELSMLDDELKELLIERRTYKQLLQEGDE